MDEPLQLMVELQGDSLRSPAGPAGAAIRQRVTAALTRSVAAMQQAEQTQHSPTQQLNTCSGCKRVATTLRKCGACMQAQVRLGVCVCARSAWLHLACALTLPLCLTTPPQPRVPEATLAGAQGGVQGSPAWAEQLTGVAREWACDAKVELLSVKLAGQRHFRRGVHRAGRSGAWATAAA